LNVRSLVIVLSLRLRHLNGNVFSIPEAGRLSSNAREWIAHTRFKLGCWHAHIHSIDRALVDKRAQHIVLAEFRTKWDVFFLRFMKQIPLWVLLHKQYYQHCLSTLIKCPIYIKMVHRNNTVLLIIIIIIYTCTLPVSLMLDLFSLGFILYTFNIYT